MFLRVFYVLSVSVNVFSFKLTHHKRCMKHASSISFSSKGTTVQPKNPKKEKVIESLETSPQGRDAFQHLWSDECFVKV